MLIDMNLTPRWCKLFESRQHDAFHWSSIGPKTASDSEVWEYARYCGLTFLTSDPDFPQTIGYTAGRGRIIMLLGDLLIPELRGLQVLNTIKEYRDRLLKGGISCLDWRSDPSGIVTFKN